MVEVRFLQLCLARLTENMSHVIVVRGFRFLGFGCFCGHSEGSMHLAGVMATWRHWLIAPGVDEV
jgi:hypothetical protein